MIHFKKIGPTLVNTFGDSNRSSKMHVTTSGTSTLSRALAYGMRNKHYYTKDFPLHIILGKGSHYLTNTEDPINRARVGCSVVITGASRETTCYLDSRFFMDRRWATGSCFFTIGFSGHKRPLKLPPPRGTGYQGGLCFICKT